MYSDPVLQKYIDLIKAKSGAIQTFFQGEPTRIANSLLPCCVVTKVKTDVSPLENTSMQQDLRIRITVITDVRQDFSTEESHQKLVEGISTLYDLMEGRNEDFTLKDTSILSVIRANSGIAANLFTDVETATHIDYGIAQRGPATVTVEGRMEFTAKVVQ